MTPEQLKGIRLEIKLRALLPEFTESLKEKRPTLSRDTINRAWDANERGDVVEWVRGEAQKFLWERNINVNSLGLVSELS